MSLHGGEDGQSCAEHGSHNLAWNGVGNREHKSLVNTDMTSISAPCLVVIAIVCVVCIDLVRTIIFIVAFTLLSVLKAKSILYDTQDMPILEHRHQHDHQP